MADQEALASDVAGLSFEYALAELEKIVRSLEDGRSKLKDAAVSHPVDTHDAC